MLLSNLRGGAEAFVPGEAALESERMRESSVLLGGLQEAFDPARGVADATFLTQASAGGRKEAFLG